jgi:hypothetical protein
LKGNEFGLNSPTTSFFFFELTVLAGLLAAVRVEASGSELLLVMFPDCRERALGRRWTSSGDEL